MTSLSEADGILQRLGIGKIICRSPGAAIIIGEAPNMVVYSFYIFDRHSKSNFCTLHITITDLLQQRNASTPSSGIYRTALYRAAVVVLQMRDQPLALATIAVPSRLPILVLRELDPPSSVRRMTRSLYLALSFRYGIW